MSSYWNVLQVVQQAMAEMGLPKPVQVVTSADTTVQQMLSLLNRAGADMVIGFPWEQLDKEWTLQLVQGQTEYDLPADWSYFLDQTQWDRTNHWPLLGPKSAQEWQWLKGGMLSSGPRIRYRIQGGKFQIFPVNADGNGPQSLLAMEYIANTWLMSANDQNTFFSLIQSDDDIIMFDPWVISSYLKLKYWEAKGLDTTAYAKDFVGTWEARIGKNKGAPVLTMSPRARSLLIGINNVPDGTWWVYPSAPSP